MGLTCLTHEYSPIKQKVLQTTHIKGVYETEVARQSWLSSDFLTDFYKTTLLDDYCMGLFQTRLNNLKFNFLNFSFLLHRLSYINLSDTKSESHLE